MYGWNQTRRLIGLYHSESINGLFNPIDFILKMKKFKNKFGIKINICCASCQYKGFDKKGERICTLTGEQVDSNNICDDWHLREGLENAGLGDRKTIKL